MVFKPSTFGVSKWTEQHEKQEATNADTKHHNVGPMLISGAPPKTICCQVLRLRWNILTFHDSSLVKMILDIVMLWNPIQNWSPLPPLPPRCVRFCWLPHCEKHPDISSLFIRWRVATATTGTDPSILHDETVNLRFEQSSTFKTVNVVLIHPELLSWMN